MLLHNVFIFNRICWSSGDDQSMVSVPKGMQTKAEHAEIGLPGRKANCSRDYHSVIFDARG